MVLFVSLKVSVFEIVDVKEYVKVAVLLVVEYLPFLPFPAYIKLGTKNNKRIKNLIL